MSPRFYDFRAESLGAVPYRWAVLQFEFSGPFLVLYYEDSVGYREKHVWQWTPAAIASQDDSPWGTATRYSVFLCPLCSLNQDKFYFLLPRIVHDA